jgi:2-amino-4-hydroxy-6-hydroxymethyldihydropteridine diphosphokinase
VGDALAHLRAAADALPVVARSSVYLTEPQGEVLDQPDFLNAAVRIETSLSPERLLQLVKGVEAELGRDFSQVRHGPRVVDVDLLLLGDLSFSSDRLTLPHPEVLTRRFVLEPLLELDPSLALPDGRRLADALALLEGQRVERIGVL